MIAVVDYGMGNLHSVAKALEHVATGRTVVVTSDPAVIAKADRVVFPGQGAAPDCMRAIDAHGLREAIHAAAESKPFLGICMGLQVLFTHSAEGSAAPTPPSVVAPQGGLSPALGRPSGGTSCLGLFDGEVQRFGTDLRNAAGERLKVPHMGWNNVRQVAAHPLWDGIADGERFYFVHSYFVVPQDHSIVVGEADYPAPFTCAVARDNRFAVQFHPEKSATAGLRLLQNFVVWQP